MGNLSSVIEMKTRRFPNNTYNTFTKTITRESQMKSEGQNFDRKKEVK